VNTTGEVRIEAGQPRAASAVPLDAAAVTGSKATVFVVAADTAAARKATFNVLGERNGTLYLDTSLKPGTVVVTEGRAVLADGDAVTAKQVEFTAAAATAMAQEPSK
jgi:hypothetical protein